MTPSDSGQRSRTLGALLDLLPIGVAIARDSACSWIDVNPVAAAMLGVSKGENASMSRAEGELKFKVFHEGRELDPTELPMQVSARTGAEVRDFQVDLVHEDGRQLQLLEYASPLRDEAGEIAGCLGLFVDVTPYWEAERQRLRLQGESDQRLHEVNESLEQRVAERTIEARERAEQLRTLALALADAEARERKRIGQSLHDQLQQILSAAKLKAGIVRRSVEDSPIKTSLSELERLIEQAIRECRLLVVDLAPPVLYEGGLNRAIEALARRTEERQGVKIHVDCDEAAEPREEQLRVLLFEAVREMLQNAVQHAEAGEINIRSLVSGPNQMQIVIEDDGKGFDVERLSMARGKSDPGRLGLIEIRERMNHIGGDLQIRSEVDRGTMVVLSAPGQLRLVDTDRTSAGDISRSLRQLEPGGAGRNATILVADDHAIFREGLIGLLRQEKFLEVVGEAGDGQQAIELARQLRPDILLVDISMPKLNGVEVTEILSRELPLMRIVGLSMHDSDDMGKAMRDAGAAAYLTKDSASDTLVGVLRAVIRPAQKH